MMNETYFAYPPNALDHLKKRDKKMARLIAAAGVIERTVEPDLFTALLKNIAGQQISGRALGTVLARLGQILPDPWTPDAVLAAGEGPLASCGLSRRKAGCMMAAAKAFQNGSVNPDELNRLDDEAVIARLTQLPGVGRWTAEMLLLFSLQRTNVLSAGDFGIRRGLQLLYHHQTLTADRIARYRRRYTPYGSIASFYLWAAANGSLKETADGKWILCTLP